MLNIKEVHFMKILHQFSLKGLRRFQSILSLLSIFVFLLLFLADSLFVKGFSIFFNLAIFRVLQTSQKIVMQKVNKSLYEELQQNMVSLHDSCLSMIKQLEVLFSKKGYSYTRQENSMIDRLYRELASCSTVKDYRYFNEEIRLRLLFVAGLPMNEEKKESASSDRVKQTNTSSDISPYLKVLNLPSETRDMVVIKTAYKKLIKKYHPDINPSVEAGEKAIQLNLAYEQLKKNIGAS